MSSSPARGQEFRFATLSSGARIAWTRSGRRDAPVLVRVAHWLTHVEYDTRSPVWGPWVEHLSRAFRLVRYDERGCGLSGDDARPRSLEAWLEELEAVIEATGERQVALLGTSGAAAIAIAYAVRHPKRVSHLVLLGGYLHGALHRCATAEERAFLEAQWRLVELGWGRNDPAVREFFTSRFVPAAPPEVREGLNEQQRRSCNLRCPLLLIGAVYLKAETSCRLIGSLGLLNFHWESNAIKLWIPENSDFVRNYDYLW